MKRALFIVLGLLLGVTSVSAMNLENDQAYKNLKARFTQVEWIRGIQLGQLKPEDFIQAMGNNIKKAVSEVVIVVADFANPANPKETFSQYIEKSGMLANTINEEIIEKLKGEIAAIDANPCLVQSTDYQIMVLTLKIVSDFYAKFLKVHQVLVNHRKSAKPTDAAALAPALEAPLLALVSAQNLTMLESDLGVLDQLLTEQNYKSVAQDIKDLRSLLSKVKGSVGTMTGSAKMELLAKIRRRLQRL